MYARLENNEVVEIIDFDPSGKFHPSLKFVEFDGRKNVKAGDIFDGADFSRPEINIESAMLDALNRIDISADSARRSDRSIGQYLDAEYRFVYDALAEYRSGAGHVPQAIMAHADAEGVTVDEAAEVIAESAARAEERLLEIRRIRLAGKSAIRKASKDFSSVAQPYIDDLNSLGEKDVVG